MYTEKSVCLERILGKVQTKHLHQIQNLPTEKRIDRIWTNHENARESNTSVFKPTFQEHEVM